MREKKIVVVCGYGCELHPAYKRYLQCVAQFVNRWHVAYVIVCGGPTQQKSFPGQTEARVMKAFLQGTLGVLLPIAEDNESYTSFTNLLGARHLINGLFAKPSEYELVIFCDVLDALGLKIIAERMFKGYCITMETYDLAPQGTALSQLWQTIADALAAYVPLVNFFKETIRQIQARSR